MKRTALLGLLAIALVLAVGGPMSGAAGSAAPTGLTGIALDHDVQLAWQPVSGASGYTVYRGTSPTAVNTRLTAATGVAATSYDDTTAVDGTTYDYAVRAIVGGVETASSLVVQARPVPRACSTGNPTVLENCYPGNTGFDARSSGQISAGGIEGYATATSIQKGDSIGLKVNAADGATFNVFIYRTGYYGGAEARLYSELLNIPAVRQPQCTRDGTTGLLDCSSWALSATVTTTSSWPSGVYLLRIVRNDTGMDNEILFVVRDDSRHSDLLYGTAMSTFQAYNNYGGKSLYTFNSSGNVTVSGTARAVKVSYDRPFEQPRSGLRDWYPNTEIATVAWLEEEGYDVSYISNTDLEANAGLILTHKAYVSPAHDEYVSAAMRSAMENARDSGVNLWFSGSNEVYWKIRFEASPVSGQAGRVQVCYKTVESGGPDPSGTSTSTWRDPNGPNDPENSLSGEMYVGDNDTSYFPLVVTAAEGTDRLFRFTGLDQQAPGTSTTIGSNLVGWEWDARVANGDEPAGVKTLTSSPVSGELVQGNGHSYINGTASPSAVKYVAPSGALVFTTGTNHWNRGLALNAFGVGEPNIRIQQITTNALEDMGVVPATPDPDIKLDNGAGGPPAPTGVTGTATGSDSVKLTWSAVTGATGYNVYRALAPRDGGEPLGTLVSPTGLSATTFTDTGLASATTYYYVVTAVVNGVQSVPSTEVAVTTSAAAGDATRIDVGGSSDYTSSSGAVYRADAFFTGGTVNDVGSRAIAGTNDPGLYDTERYGSFSYAIPVANGTYDIRFHFVELYYGSNGVAGGAGKRVFGMDVTNTPTSPDLANIDVYKAVGANTAYDLTVTGVTVTNGVLGITSVPGSADVPEVAAIEVVPVAGAPTVTSTTPANGATGVATGVHPTATFSAAIDPSTLTSSSFSLTKTSGGTAIPATISYDGPSRTATLTPTSALAASTSYTLGITTAVHAADGTPLAAPVSAAFTTAAPVAPTVTSTFPAAGATGVSPSTSVQAVFSAPLDPTTVTSSSFTLTGAGGSVAATVSYDAGSQTATLVPTSALALSTTYTARLSTAVAGTNGAHLASAFSWTFTTAASAPAAPTIVSTSPAASATNVLVGTKVTATFSTGMDPSSIGTSTFTLASSAGPVTATVAYDGPSKTATLTPSASLAPSTTYTAKVAGTVRATSGTALGAAVSWTFTTIGAPTVVSTAPADGATAVATSTPVTAIFSRAMDASTITPSSFTLQAADGSTVSASVSYDAASSTARLVPDALLDSHATYTARLAATVSAADGTPLAQAVSWSFSTASCPCSLMTGLVPSVTAVPVQDNRTGSGPFTYELGTKFTADTAMQLTAIRFYKSAGETGTHLGRIWSSSGVQLASASFSNETASGWQTATLSSPLELQAGSVYVVSVNANAFFVTTPAGLISSIGSGPLSTVADGANGVFAGTAGSFPTQTYNSSNYFVDVVASPDASVPAPAVTATTPADGATGVAATVKPTATFSRAIDPSTLTTSSFRLTGSSGAVAASVAYDATSRTATLTPSAALTAGASYTLHVDATIQASDGTPLAAPVTATFTVAPPTAPQVTSVAPAAGSSDAGPSTIVRAVFSLPLDPSTVTTSTFTLADGTTPVAATVSYAATTQTASLTPSASLVAGHTYTARLDASITAQNGGRLGSAVTWSFTVAASSSPPTIVATTPAAGATSVSRTDPITVGFSRSMDPTTITTTTFTLKDASGTTVPATVTYDAASKTATLKPSSTLAAQATYTATVTTGAMAIDETPLAANTSWTFTTAACPCTLFAPSSAPASTGLSTQDGRSGSGPFTYELGVKVQVDGPTQVTAIRFYKSPGETGTHVGRIWSQSGTLLASTTFGGESSSGWQEQSLGTPFTLQSGTTYTISVNANSRFVVTSGGLTSSVSSGPLHTVADGKNGVFASAAGSFPTQTYASSNYFVDLVGTPGGTAAAPTVVSTSPSGGATGVAASTAVRATFSEALDASTVSASTFTLTGPSGAVAGTVSYDAGTHTATLTPSAALTASATYTARLGTGIRASDGTPLASAVSWSFTVAAATAPAVTQTAPADGATGVAGSVAPRATFSRALDPTTVTSSSFTLTGPNGAVAGTVAYDSATTSASLTPSAALAAGTYTARLAASIAATDGTTLGSAYSWNFTVSATPSLTVTGRTPSPGATNVPRTTTVTATFSASLDPATVTSSTVQLRDGGGNAVAASVAYDDPSRTITLTPSSTLSASTTYTVDVSTGVHGADGTPLGADDTWTFTTDPCPCSLFSSSDGPSSTGNPTSDGRDGSGPFSYELGVKITVDRPVQLIAIRFWKDSAETGSHTGNVWSSSGTLLGSTSFSGESGSGWQQATLSSPVSLQPGNTYVVSVGINASFGVTVGGLGSSISNGPLHSVADGANGVFATSAGSFPTQTYQSSDYFVDAVVQ